MDYSINGGTCAYRHGTIILVLMATSAMCICIYIYISNDLEIMDGLFGWDCMSKI
jgi:hypothetical protein